jgi:hypothetical protein
MSDYDKMRISEMRKMVKEHRKAHMTPVGKMSKIALMKELDKYAGTPSTMPSMAPVEVKRASAVKEEVKVEEGKKAKKMPAMKTKIDYGVQGHTSHTPTAMAKAEVEPKKEVARARLIKGSQEAREFMAMIRAKKSKSKDVN